VVMLVDGREALVTARVESGGGQVTALLEVAVAPKSVASDGKAAEAVSYSQGRNHSRRTRQRCGVRTSPGASTRRLSR
jgi:hypothetical protein